MILKPKLTKTIVGLWFAVFTFERDYENAKEFFETLERNGVSLSPIQ